MKKKKVTIGFNLYSIFIISIIVPFLIVSAIFLFFYHDIFMNRQKQNIKYVLASVSRNIEAQYKIMDNIGNTFYIQNEIFKEIESLNKPELYQYYSELDRTGMSTNYTSVMTKLIHTSGISIKGVTFFPESDEIKTAYYIGKRYAQIFPVEGYAYKEEAWYGQAVSADGRGVLYPGHEQDYIGKGPEEVYSYVRAMKNMDSGKIIGVVKIDASMNDLTELLNVVGDQSALMISEGGRSIARSDGVPDGEILLTGDSTVFVGNRKYYYQKITLPVADWNLIYLLDNSVFWKSYSYAVGCVAVIVLAGLGVAFLIYRNRSKAIVNDVRNITAALKEIEVGNMEVTAAAEGNNELTDIADAVNHMVHNLKHYIEQEYILVINQQKAQYNALQSQINPHFLYNTLNGFIGLNRMGEKKKLEQSIISLTHLFRYTCRSQDTTTVEEEFAFLEEYLKLEKLKYEERLEYMVWLADDCRHFVIPKLLLQPIVENSIVHGMENLERPIMITLVAKLQEVKGIGRVVLLSVRDNGTGFDVDKKLGEDRVGVVNVQHRAALYCRDSLYQTVSEPGRGTKTTFVFPESGV